MSVRERELKRFASSDIESAQDHLSEICKNIKMFTMSVPPQRSDTDMLFSRVFDRAEKLQKKLELTEKKVELYREKDEVVNSWNYDLQVKIKKIDEQIKALDE